MHYLADNWSFDPFAILAAIIVCWHEVGLARLARRSRPEQYPPSHCGTRWSGAGEIGIVECGGLFDDRGWRAWPVKERGGAGGCSPAGIRPRQAGGWCPPLLLAAFARRRGGSQAGSGRASSTGRWPRLLAWSATRTGSGAAAAPEAAFAA